MRAEAPTAAWVETAEVVSGAAQAPAGDAEDQMDWDDKVSRNFVNGGWAFAKHGYEISVHSPTTIEDLGEIPRSARADVETAVDAAQDALRFDLRAAVLRCAERFAEGLRRTEIAAVEQADSGVPRRFAQAMADRCADWIEASRDRSAPNDPPGCHGLILPAYAPFWLYCLRAFDALAAGHAVVLKPSSVSPLTAVCFADLVAGLDLPPGAFALLQGTGGDAGAALARCPRLDRLDFIGRRATARMVARGAAENLTPCRIGSGNLNPSILYADGDAEEMVDWLVGAALRHAGQAGFASRWCLVPEHLMDAVLAMLRDAVRACCQDDCSEGRHAAMAPLASEHRLFQAENFLDNLGSGDERSSIGARFKPAAHPMGYFLAPSLLVDASAAELRAGADLPAPILFLTGYASEDALAEQLLALRPCGTAHVFSARGQNAMPTELRRRLGRVRDCTEPFAPAGTLESFWHEINARGAETPLRLKEGKP